MDAKAPQGYDDKKAILEYFNAGRDWEFAMEGAKYLLMSAHSHLSNAREHIEGTDTVLAESIINMCSKVQDFIIDSYFKTNNAQSDLESSLRKIAGSLLDESDINTLESDSLYRSYKRWQQLY